MSTSKVFLTLLALFSKRQNDATSSFTLTAISALNGKSTLECWQLREPFTISTTPGLAGAPYQQLGDLANASWFTLPPNYVGPSHPAPNVQYVVFLSGFAQITIPDSPQRAEVIGGKHGIIFASDTHEKSLLGHVSKVGPTEVTALMIPTKGGVVPPHVILYRRPCEPKDLNY